MSPRQHAGVALVEVVTALALGLLLTLLASALLVAANSGYRNHSESVWLNDAGRYALEIAGQAIRQAGYVDWDDDAAPPTFDPGVSASVAGLDARSVSRDSDGISGALPPVANGSDVLALRYTGSGSGANGDGSALNCAGFGVAGHATPERRGWSIFYVAEDAQGEPELRCKYLGANGWGADAIVRGVDSFQVLYGVDTDSPPDDVPNTYVNASILNALDDALVLHGVSAAARQRDRNRQTWWKRVRAIRIGLLLRGDVGSRPGGSPGRFDLFGRAYTNAHGGDDPGVCVVEQDLAPAMRVRARQLFVSTVMLRNRSI